MSTHLQPPNLGRYPIQVFVHCSASRAEYRLLSTVLSGLSRFAERAVVMASERDVVLVNHPIERSYLDFLHSINLGPAADRVVVVSQRHDSQRPLAARAAEDTEVLGRLAALVGGGEMVEVNPFMLCRPEQHLASQLARRLGRPVQVLGGNVTGIAETNRKHRVRQLALELGVPVAPGEVFYWTHTIGRRDSQLRELERCLNRQLRSTGRIIVRGTCGAMGCSTFVANNDSIDACIGWASALTDNSALLIEVMLPVTVSPNICTYINPVSGHVSVVGTSDQLLDDDVTHRGNVFPSRAQCIGEMIDCAVYFTSRLRDTGITGHLGFDFCEYSLGGSRRNCKFFLAEINPRINGATYSHSIVASLNKSRKLSLGSPLTAFMTQKLDTAAQSFEQLWHAYGDLFYDTKTAAGIVPYNIGALAGGHCLFAAIGEDAAAVARLANRLKVEKESRERRIGTHTILQRAA
jgi:hypothetical protein